jgi:hypothetical protein
MFLYNINVNPMICKKLIMHKKKHIIMQTQALIIISNRQNKNKGQKQDYVKYFEIIWSSISLKLIEKSNK